MMTILRNVLQKQDQENIYVGYDLTADICEKIYYGNHGGHVE